MVTFKAQKCIRYAIVFVSLCMTSCQQDASNSVDGASCEAGTKLALESEVSENHLHRPILGMISSKHSESKIHLIGQAEKKRWFNAQSRKPIGEQVSFLCSLNEFPFQGGRISIDDYILKISKEVPEKNGKPREILQSMVCDISSNRSLPTPESFISGTYSECWDKGYLGKNYENFWK